MPTATALRAMTTTVDSLSSSRFSNPEAKLHRVKKATRKGRGRTRMKLIADWLIKLGILKKDLDYHLIRASLVLIFLFFGYQKWFEYEAQGLIPYISHGPLIFWMYPVFGLHGATWFLGVSEWLFGALLFAGFWNKNLGILGALGAVATFVSTATMIPFIPQGWAASAGGFPAMTERVAFLMKDIVLLAASIYLLKQDIARSSLTKNTSIEHDKEALLNVSRSTA
jgi:uncharacterized membrane protein YkgB